MNRAKAVVEAGHKRARPIVMTSIAMSAGMLPSALGVGEGGTFRAPMAIAVIGGIIVSTVLSLVVPCRRRGRSILIMDDLSRAACRGMTAPPRRTGRPRRCGRDGERARRSRVRAPGGGTFCGAGHPALRSVQRPWRAGAEQRDADDQIHGGLSGSG
jgi:hypothetical protein